MLKRVPKSCHLRGLQWASCTRGHRCCLLEAEPCRAREPRGSRVLICSRTPCSRTLRRTEARSAPLTGLLPGTGGGPALSLCHVFSHVVHSGHVLPPHTFLVRAACMLRSTAGPGGYCHILGFQGAADSLGGPLLTGRCCQGTAGLKMPVHHVHGSVSHKSREVETIQVSINRRMNKLLSP